MEVYAGEIVGLIGPAGAGKSTLLQHCNGLLRPTEPGHVIVDGQDLADPTVDLRRLRQMVGIVFQHPERQLFETLVGDDIAFGPRQLGVSREEIRRRVEWAMRVVGLDFDTFVDRPTAALSGGERRKVAIAGVLALRPRVLILDEASAGLDPLTREEWLEQVRRLNAEEDMTVIVVSSDMEEIAALAGRVYVMAGGRMVDEGTPAEVFARADLLNSLGLGQPVTSWVLGELRRRGYDVDPYAIRLEKTVEELCRILRS
jgi:energy-coupling factor transport system ATP-binding protein